MRKNLFFLLFCSSTYIFAQVVLGQKDDFEDYTTRNWTKNNSIANQNIYDGGPLGAGDNFLRITSSGTGSDLELMTLNNAQWTGNYWQSNGVKRIKYISMDVRNSGSNVVFLRMSFLHYNSPNEIWSTTNPIAILPNTGWNTINFPIDEQNVVRFSGLNPYSTTFNNVQEARILHSDVPNWNGKAVETILDIDNIMARNTPFLSTNDVEKTEKKIKIIPNPVKEFILVQSTTKIENFSYRFIDSSGKIAQIGKSNNNEKINIKNLKSGVYFLQVETDNGENYFEKIIIE